MDFYNFVARYSTKKNSAFPFPLTLLLSYVFLDLYIRLSESIVSPLYDKLTTWTFPFVWNYSLRTRLLSVGLAYGNCTGMYTSSRSAPLTPTSIAFAPEMSRLKAGAPPRPAQAEECIPSTHIWAQSVSSSHSHFAQLVFTCELSSCCGMCRNLWYWRSMQQRLQIKLRRLVFHLYILQFLPWTHCSSVVVWWIGARIKRKGQVCLKKMNIFVGLIELKIRIHSLALWREVNYNVG